jgi:hypothetical protein
MSIEQEEPRVADVTLERYRLNELPRAEVERLQRRLRQDAALRGRLEAIERSDEDIRAAGGLDRLTTGLRQRLAARESSARRSSPDSMRRWLLPAALAVAVTVFALIVPRTAESPGSNAGPAPTVAKDDSDHLKGLGPTLALFRRTNAGSETLADGDKARQGDWIRIGYRAAGRHYGVILSIDARGGVTLHLPPTGGRAAALLREPTVLLDHAYELDDAPQWERFYFITADAPFDVAPMMDAARHAATRGRGTPPGAIPVPSGFEQATFSLQKETRP